MFLNPVQPVFRLPATPASDDSLKRNSAVSDDSLQKSSADEDSIAALQEALASTQERLLHLAIKASVDRFWTLPNRLPSI